MPTPMCKINWVIKAQAYVQLCTDMYELLWTCTGNDLGHFRSYRHEKKSSCVVFRIEFDGDVCCCLGPHQTHILLNCHSTLIFFGFRSFHQKSQISFSAAAGRLQRESATAAAAALEPTFQSSRWVRARRIVDRTPQLPPIILLICLRWSP